MKRNLALFTALLLILQMLPIGAAAADGLLFQAEVYTDGMTIIGMPAISGRVDDGLVGSFTLNGQEVQDAVVSGCAVAEVFDYGGGAYAIGFIAPGSGEITVTVDGIAYTLPVNVYSDVPPQAPPAEEDPEEAPIIPPAPTFAWSVDAPYVVDGYNDRVALSVANGTIERASLADECADYASLSYTGSTVTVTFTEGFVGDRLRVRVRLTDGSSRMLELELESALPELVFIDGDGWRHDHLSLHLHEEMEGSFAIAHNGRTTALDSRSAELPDLLDYTGWGIRGTDFGEDAVTTEYGGRTYTLPVEVGLPVLGFYSSKTSSTGTYIEEMTVEAVGDEVYLIARSPMKDAMMDEDLTSIADPVLSGNKRVLTVCLTEAPADGGSYGISATVGGEAHTAYITLYDGITPPRPEKPTVPKPTEPVLPAIPDGPRFPPVPLIPAAPVEPAYTLPFCDVSPDAWFYDAVAWNYEMGMMNGTAPDRFSPYRTVDRAMLVTILWRMEGMPVVNYIMPFADIPADTWYTEAVRWAAAMGIVQGEKPDVFAPLDQLTREQAAVILHRYVDAMGYDRPGGTADLSRFGDGASVSAYAREAMHWAVSNGYLRGDGRDLLPRSGMERCQLAQLMMNFVLD